MINTNIKTKRQSGFTIVELLIVIVVIGILAAITIVAYNGVQARANNTKIDALAKEVADKAEVAAADNEGTYPTAKAGFTGTAALSSAANTATVATGSPAAGQIRIVFCSSGGIQVDPYDYISKAAASAGGTAKLKVRNVGDTTTCS